MQGAQGSSRTVEPRRRRRKNFTMLGAVMSTSADAGLDPDSKG